MAENKDTKLFSEFPPVSTADWEAVITADLKGADYEKKLVWKTMEGFNVRPYYRAEDLKNLKHLGFLPAHYPYVRGTKTNNRWLVRQDIDAANPKEANTKALKVLMRGVESLGFIVDSKKGISAAELDTLLKDVAIECIETNFVAGGASLGVLPLVAEYVKKRGLNAADVKGSVNYDPLRSLTLRGKFCQDKKHAFDSAKELIEKASTLPSYKVIGVSGSMFHNSGSTIVQELGFALAVANEYLSELTERGLTVDQVASRMKFSFSVGTNYFLEVAKFRAARMLWAQIVEAYKPANVESAKMNIHAETSRWNISVYDPYANLLRGTTEAMSAAIAGVDSIAVVPFDDAFRKSTDFSDRIARNTQILLKEEAHFDKIVDPSAGSYYIETLTASIAQEAWKLFKQVEEKGGYVNAFLAGYIQEQVEATAQKRDLNIATRREIILGTNQYPNFTELAEADVTAAAVTKAVTAPCDGCVKPLLTYRGSMAFDELRYRTDKSGKEVKVFMLTTGSLAFRRARAQFAANFFACAGFRTIDNIGFPTVADGVKAALDAKADIVVICSSDDEYISVAPEAFDLLKGKAIVVVAGEPECKPMLQEKGIKNFISVKSNVLETLKEYQQMLKLL